MTFRKLLCKVVDIKMEHYEMSKIQSQTPEDYLKSFLEAEIKPLWPSGWMQTRQGNFLTIISDEYECLVSSFSF